MICHVIINDFEIGRKVIYVLNDDDFAIYQNKAHDTDKLLLALQKNEMFQGKTRWCDLDIKHFHVMVVNMLIILGKMSDDVCRDQSSITVQRLTFLLCGLISFLHDKTNSYIELFRINRVSYDDVAYNYSASLDIVIDRPGAGLKVIINND